MSKSNNTIVYIDTENFKFYIKKIVSVNTKKKVDIENIDFKSLFSTALEKITVNEIRFYSAKLRVYQGSVKKSKELIEKQRALKSKLENQGFKFIISGNVRGQTITINGKKKTVFKEKGVDVKIAVDMIADACDEKVKTIVLCSSDSDLQPAVTEAKERGAEIIYLGFEAHPNKGLIYTSNRTILLRDSEILKAFDQ